MGCQLQVELNETASGPEIIDVKGYECGRGRKYAADETVRPLRMVTTLIPVVDNMKPLSVRTRLPVPKDLIFACLDEIHSAKVQIPVKAGDCIIGDILGTGVDVIATCDLP
jgi:CxxC motif-containing protein